MKKILLILLISINSYADIKVYITNNINSRQYAAEFKNQTKVDEWIADNISNDSWGKKERWEVFVDQSTCIIIEDVMKEVDDVTIPYPDQVPMLDENGDPVLDEFLGIVYKPYTHPTVLIVDHQRCRMPVEYTIVQTDITAEVLEREERNLYEVDVEKGKEIYKSIILENRKTKTRQERKALRNLLPLVRQLLLDGEICDAKSEIDSSSILSSQDKINAGLIFIKYKNCI